MSASSPCRRYALAATAGCFLATASVVAQAQTPDVVRCADWDSAFAGAFLWAAILAAFVAAVALPWAILPLLGRRFWWASHPTKRLVLPMVAIYSLFIVVLVVLPYAAFQGYVPPAFAFLGAPGVDSRYAGCDQVNSLGIFSLGAGKVPLAKNVWLLMVIATVLFAGSGLLSAFASRVVASWRWRRA